MTLKMPPHVHLGGDLYRCTYCNEHVWDDRHLHDVPDEEDPVTEQKLVHFPNFVADKFPHQWVEQWGCGNCGRIFWTSVAPFVCPHCGPLTSSDQSSRMPGS